MDKSNIETGLLASDDLKLLFSQLEIARRIRLSVENVDKVSERLLDYYDTVKIVFSKGDEGDDSYLQLSSSVDEISPDLIGYCENLFRDLLNDMENNIMNKIITVTGKLDEITSSSAIANAKQGVDDDDESDD